MPAHRIAHSGPARAWGGAYPVCVKDGNFAIRQAVTQPGCTAEDSFALPFAPLDNRGKRVWTMNFDEQPAHEPLTAAQLAGRQAAAEGQWLQDRRDRRQAGQGDRRGADRFPQAHAFRRHRRQRRAVRRPGTAKRARRSRPPAIPSAMTAARRPAGGAGPDGRRQGRCRAAGGRWQPGACARAITTPLNSDAVYLLAQRKSRRHAGRRAAAFLHHRRAHSRSQGGRIAPARGFAEAGFAAHRTTTRHSSGYVAPYRRSGLAGLLRNLSAMLK